jgi:hypothetical protein
VYPDPVTLVEAEPRFTQRVPEPAAPSEQAPASACEACGAAMAAGQDWCLDCGTAAPGRLAPAPGRRAAGTVAALTALLLAGAGAASYAALNGSAGRGVGVGGPAIPSAVAQAPPATAQPSTPAQPPAATTPAAPPPTTPAKTIPKVAPPVTATPVKPVTPVTTPSSPASSTPTAKPKPTTPATHPNHATPRSGPTGPAPLSIDPSAGSLYDPYGRASAHGDTTHALDGNPSTAWFVTVAAQDVMGVGYLVDFVQPTTVRSLLLRTHTEGFNVEVYGTTSSALPPNVTDSHWTHLATRTNVDASQPGVKAPDGNVPGDGQERIVLGSHARGLRHVLLWFTQPPETGQTVRLNELQLFD